MPRLKNGLLQAAGWLFYLTLLMGLALALPTSIFGALVPMNIGLASINIYTQIGFVCLIGLIAKHGILMVDFANKLQDDQGYGRAAAIEHAAAVRLRPILMTTAATVVAMSRTTGGSSPAGTAIAMGLVPSSSSVPPQGGTWLALPTAA